MPSLGPVGFPGVPEPGSARREARRPGKRMGPKKFAEPVSLSSTPPADFPLPRTAARLGFVLLALRARRKQDCTRKRTSPSRAFADESAAICEGSFWNLARRPGGPVSSLEPRQVATPETASGLEKREAGCGPAPLRLVKSLRAAT